MNSREMMRRLLLVVALSVAACGEPDAPSPRSACADAFALAINTDGTASFFALLPVFRACPTVAEWTAEFDRHNGAGYLGSATEVLGQLCLAPEVADEPLCADAR